MTDAMTNNAGGHSQTLLEWARSLAPRLDVVSSSVPEPTLQPGDLLAVFGSGEAARALVLVWERIEPADQAVGFVALGTAPEAQQQSGEPSGADPEGVSTHTANRVLRGAIPGALVGGAAIGATVAAMSGSTGSVIGAVLGGAAIGAVAGGTMSMAKGTGWSEAYEHAFVDPDATDVAVVLFHSTDAARIEQAEQAARDAHAADGARLARVAADGSVTHDSPRRVG